MTLVHSGSASVPTEQTVKPAAHTPGPWGVACNPATGAFRVVSAEGQIITERSAWPTNVRECAANARLLAAAPDLLEAVWALVEYFERVDGDERHKAVIALGCAAAAKATGAAS